MKVHTSRIGLLVLIGGICFLMATTVALAMNQELVGAVVKTDQGYALSTDSGEYLLLGKGLDGLEGKTVAVTGDVENGSESSTIRVHSFKIVSNKDVIDPAIHKAGSKTR